jgi:hypothetical protein
MRTNPEYALLAYRKAILMEVISLIRQRHLSDEGADKPLYAEDVFHADAQVPRENFAQYVQELEVERADLERKLFTFELTQKQTKEQKPNVPQRPPSSKQQKQARR